MQAFSLLLILSDPLALLGFSSFKSRNSQKAAFMANGILLRSRGARRMRCQSALNLTPKRVSSISIYLGRGVVFCPVIRLSRVPHRPKMSTALKQFALDSLKVRVQLNCGFVVETVQALGIMEITTDLNGMVISTRGNLSWPFKGYNSGKRGVQSYFPLRSQLSTLRKGHRRYCNPPKLVICKSLFDREWILCK